MYTLSVMAKLKGLRFDYYSKELPKYLKNAPSGNLKHALQNGMNLFELSSEEYEKISNGYGSANDELFVPQGGACDYAREGLELLADELNEFCAAQNMRRPKVIISCGTGTSALYLAHRFKGEVYAVPCVGDGAYLQKQFEALSPDARRPNILSTAKKYHFGKLYGEIHEAYLELLEGGVEFDLLYDCVAWIAVRENLAIFDEETIFVHSGGLRGNETMIERYERKAKIATLVK
jgi:1-aminocyclopropane-1-carboxylate deaminase